MRGGILLLLFIYLCIYFFFASISQENALSRKGGSGGLPQEKYISPDVCRYDFNALWDNFCPGSAAYFIGFIMMQLCPGRKP